MSPPARMIHNDPLVPELVSHTIMGLIQGQRNFLWQRR
jgi:hypothetical protein